MLQPLSFLRPLLTWATWTTNTASKADEHLQVRGISQHVLGERGDELTWLLDHGRQFGADLNTSRRDSLLRESSVDLWLHDGAGHAAGRLTLPSSRLSPRPTQNCISNTNSSYFDTTRRRGSATGGRLERDL